MLSFGTYRLKRNETHRLVTFAIQHGVYNFDTAQLYGNEEEVYMATSQFDSKEIKVTTKIHPKLIKNSYRENRIESSIIGTPTAVLLHTPEKNYTIAWEQLKRLDNVKLGVSNFSVAQMEKLSSLPLVNQLEISPYNQPIFTINFCRSNNIEIEAHSPLVKGKVFTEEVLSRVCANLNKRPANVLLRWSQQHFFTPIFGTSNPDHLLENTSLNFTIPEESMYTLSKLNVGLRTHQQFHVK